MSAPLPPSLARLFEIVAASDNLAADDAFVAAIPHLDSTARIVALDLLIRRNKPWGLSALVAGYMGYDEGLRAAIVERVSHLAEATRHCIASNTPDTRLSAIELIRAARDCGLCYLLAGSLTRSCPKTTAAAAAAILEMAEFVIADGTGGASNSDAPCKRQKHARQLADALTIALDAWPAHFRGEVVTASLWLADVTETVLLGKAGIPKSRLSRAIAESLRANSDARTAGFALRALRSNELRTVAAREIATHKHSEYADRLLDESWLTLDPEVAKSCAWIRSLPWAANESNYLSRLTGRRARQAVRLIALSGLPQETKLRLFERFMTSGSPELRLSALQRVIDVPHSDATQCLERIATLAEDPLSSIAAHECFRRDPSRERANMRESRPQPSTSPSPSPSRSTSPSPPASSTHEFDDAWERFDEMDDDRRGRYLSQLVDHWPSSRTHIVRKLDSETPADRLTALRIIRAIDKTGDFDQRVYALSHDSNERVRSQAVSMLSDIEGPTAMRILRHALNDPDARVQANAIEGISSLMKDLDDCDLSAKLSAGDNRVRANAIKTLVGQRVRDAAVALIHMLGHDLPTHRLSALWVVEQLQLNTLEPRIRKIAELDPDKRVRDRAIAVLDRMNQGFAQPAQIVEHTAETSP